MDSLSYKTISANASTVTKEWVVIDATNEVLGRLASQVAKILRGKNKPCYTPHVDCGDYVIVINAEKVKLTGNKMTKKVYTRHTGYPGGQRFATPADYLAKKPTFLVEKAVKGMLPKTRLGEKLLTNLKVYAGAEHPHAAQNPKVMEVVNTVGRRKAAVARVFVKPGKGQITINHKELAAYFPLEILQFQVKQPLLATNTAENYDIVINLDGGGIKGQAEAARLGIARALCEIDAEMRPVLKKAGFLTRDPREVERKKPGQPGARRKFQFSKR